MKKPFATIYILTGIFICAAGTALQASDVRLQAMGDMIAAAPDEATALNLYRFAGNNALLLLDIPDHQMRYAYYSDNNWGDLRRTWDAKTQHHNYFLFTGVRRLGENHTFFGQINYGWDFRGKVRKAIEYEPYASDPFVLADSSEGDIDYYGPQISVAYAARPFTNLFVGVGLDYRILRGLKLSYSRPEIILTGVKGHLDLAYKAAEGFFIGCVIKPYHRQEITKLVKQPEGTDPETFRYRGEFEFSKALATSPRTAVLKGYDIGPQVSLQKGRWHAIVTAGYVMGWQEIFDGEATHNYDGDYQSEQYYAKSAVRYFWDNSELSAVTLGYRLWYLQDWAKEPQAGFMIYRSIQRRSQAQAGISYRLSILPLLLAAELNLDWLEPARSDYLAHRHRRGLIRQSSGHFGFETERLGHFRMRGGAAYNKYDEAEVWNYFGDYEGWMFSAGAGYENDQLSVELFLKYSNAATRVREPLARREILNFGLEIRRNSSGNN
jgi:hypothetical protein